MSHADISLIYEGSAVESGQMDVRDLAPALLAFGNLIEAANKTINGENALTKVKVKTVGAGSFSIGFDVTVDFVNTIRDAFAGPEGTAAANLVTVLTGGGTLVGGTAYGVISLVRWLSGTRPTAIERQSRGTVRVMIDDQEIEVDEVVARVALEPTARAALERVVTEPLRLEGLDAVQIGLKENVQRIEKSEMYFFSTLNIEDSTVYESRYRAPFSIVNLSFKEGNKWRLNDGKTVLSVSMLDKDFIARVDRSEISFSKGDILICEVRVETRERPGGLQSETFIDKVFEHRKPMQQISFFDTLAGDAEK